MSPDLQQNLIITLYLLFTHNAVAIAYLSGLLLSLALSFYRPSRFTTLTTISFGILLFAYEYDKHIIAGLREQTINSLITATPHYRLQRIINLTISEIVPMVLFTAGWLSLFIAIYYAAKKISRHTSR